MKILIQMIIKFSEMVLPAIVLIILIQFLVYRIFKFSIFNFIIKEFMKEVNKWWFLKQYFG